MLRDPVTGFEYPETWAAACRDPQRRALVAAGLAVLTASGAALRRGFTTGTTAAAAAKAAVLSLAGGEPASVDLTLPCGIAVSIPVTARQGRATARKDPGDYPEDATAGAEFVAAAKRISGGIEIDAGEGIGRWMRDTPRARRGEPAISRTALESIERAVAEAVEAAGLAGARVELSVPQGRRIARQTLNPRIGIEGGISILGTTGLVEPWDDHLVESVIERIERSRRVVLATGRTGLRYARLLFPAHEVVLVGSRIGAALDAAKGDVVLCGLPGLILRFIDPGILEGTGCATVEELVLSPSWEAARERALGAYRERYPWVRVVLLAREGRILGESGC